MCFHEASICVGHRVLWIVDTPSVKEEVGVVLHILYIHLIKDTLEGVITPKGFDLLDGLAGWVPDLRVERLPAASHWVQADEPGLVSELLVEFLAA